jgi:hypothetical protein
VSVREVANSTRPTNELGDVDLNAAAWTLVGIGSWMVLSLPLSLVLVAMVDRSCPGPVDDLPVIAEADRRPLPPHLREPVLQG